MTPPPHDSRLLAGRSGADRRACPFVRSFRLGGTIRELALATDRLPAMYEFGGGETAAAPTGQMCEPDAVIRMVPLGRN